MSTQVVEYSPTPSMGELQTMERIASSMHQSGMFKDLKSAQAAFVKIALGRGLGLDPASSMTAIHFVEGKPELSANLQAAMLRRYVGVAGERYDFEVERLDNEACILNFTRLWPDGKVDLLGTSSFTMADAEAAGLTKPTRNGAPSNYVKFARNMVYARAMSNGVAWFCPEVTYGIRVYSDGEIDPSRVPDAPQDLPEQVATPGAAAALPAVNQPQAQPATAPAAADVPRPSREDYAALGAARKAAGLSDEQVHELFDAVGVMAAPSLRVRAQNMTREQLTSAIARLEFTQPPAGDQPDDAPPVEPVQEAIPGTAEEMPTGQPTEGVMGA